MLKPLIILILNLLVFQIAKAQKPDTIIYYMKDNGQILSDRHNADYSIVVLPPDTAEDPNLFVVNEFYPDGKIKLRTKSVNSTLPLHFDGPYLSYYENGHKYVYQTIENGITVGEIDVFYPNGKLYITFSVNKQKRFLNECRDSTGKVLCKNGNGQWLGFDQKFKNMEQGSVIDGLAEGEWNGQIADSIKYTVEFKKGEVRSGIGYDRAGKAYPFKKIYVDPKFGNGNESFGQFLSDNYHVPEYARQHHLLGTVNIGFTIEKDGTIDNIHIIQGQAPSLNDEALREVGLTPSWAPAKFYGVPVSCDWHVPIYFAF